MTAVSTTTPPGAAPGPTLGLTIILAAVTALGPFALQLVAPALPTLSAALETSREKAQLLVSLSMWALAAGAVVYGPLADRYGRRPVMIGGLGLALIGGVMATVAETYETALIGRLLQSAGGGVGMVLSRAIARDLFAYPQAALLIARITALMVVAPMVAPLLGGVLIENLGWRAVFGATAAALMLLLLVIAALRESLPAPSPRLSLASAIGDYRAIISRRAFLAHTAFAASSISSFFLFVGGAPYVMERAYGYGPTEYGALFLAVAGAFSAANFASPRITRSLGPEPTILLGASASAAASTLFAVVIWAGGDSAEMLVAGAALGALGAGVALPNALAGAVEAAPERAGSAAGLISVLQFLAAGVAAQAASALPVGSGAPLATMMAAAAILGAVGYAALARPAS